MGGGGGLVRWIAACGVGVVSASGLDAEEVWSVVMLREESARGV